MQEVLVYDGSFEGLLSCIYTIYAENRKDFKVIRQDMPSDDLFASQTLVRTDIDQANKVWQMFSRKSGRVSQERVLFAYLADQCGEEQTIIHYIKLVIDSKRNQEQNLANSWVKRMQELVQLVNLERLRIKTTLQFELLENSIYYANIDTKYNVLPLISYELSKRRANKPWIIYDNRRNYGVHFNLLELKEMKVAFAENPAPYNIFNDEGLLLSVLKSHKHLSEQQVLVQYRYQSKMSNALITGII
jgi:probable DNA metabolism protein